jgi:hypothetical protein
MTNHRFSDYEAVVYSSEGGTVIGGLTSGNTYIIGSVTTNSFQLFNNRNEVFTAATAISLTPATAGNGENHSLRRTPSTRPDLTITGTGGTFDADGCAFGQFRTFTGTSKATFTDCTFTNMKDFDLVGATITRCTFDEPLSSPGETQVTASGDEMENVTESSFVSSSSTRISGHAIEIDAAPTGGTLDFNNITFTGYGPDVQTFNASSNVDVDADDRIDISGHPYATGDPVYYLPNDPADGTAGTVITGLTSNALYYVRSVSANEITLHLSREAATTNANVIGLTAGSSEIHALYSASAAVVNSTNGDITINVLNGGSSPSYRNTGTGTVTVNNSVTLKFEGVAEGSACIIDAAETVGTVTTGDRLLEALADTNGEASTGLNYEGAFDPSGLDVVARVRNQGFPNAAIAANTGGTVFVDETTEANSTTASDMNLLPATQALNDAYYFGHNEEFGRLKLQISSEADGVFTITWEYWNGSAWTALSGVTDGTSGFSIGGPQIVSWTIPGNWADTTINSQGPFRYVRARVSSFTSSGTQPLGRWCKLDVTRYLPFTQNRIVTSGGLTVNVSQVEDTISTF